MKIVRIFIAFSLMVSVAYAEDTFYCVQVAKCVKLENAVSIHNGLRRYKNRKIAKVNGVYEVTVGSYRSKEKAGPLLKQMQTIYSDAFIRPCPKDVANVAQKKIITGQEEKKPEPLPPAGIMKEKSPINQAVTVPSVSENKQDIQKVAVSELENYYKKGIQHFRNQQYGATIAILSQYISLSPDGIQCPAALFVIARSLEAMDRPLAAVGTYGRILDQYPQSQEALLSIIAMADIGVANPALHYPVFKSGCEYVKDPILGYDTVLTKKIPEQMMADILLHKGRAFWKKGQYKESYEIYANLLKEYPNSLYRKEMTGTAKACIVILVDQHRKAGDHIAAVNLFFEARKKGLIDADNMDTILKCSLSLANLGLYDESFLLVDAARTSLRGRDPSEINKTVAEINHMKVANAALQLQPDMNWELFQSGREYLNSNKRSLAEQTLAKLKKDGGEPFWTKVTDYVLEDKRWNQKNRDDLSDKR